MCAYCIFNEKAYAAVRCLNHPLPGGSGAFVGNRKIFLEPITNKRATKIFNLYFSTKIFYSVFSALIPLEMPPRLFFFYVFGGFFPSWPFGPSFRLQTSPRAFEKNCSY